MFIPFNFILAIAVVYVSYQILIWVLGSDMRRLQRQTTVEFKEWLKTEEGIKWLKSDWDNQPPSKFDILDKDYSLFGKDL
jgi:hypothetical protein